MLSFHLKKLGEKLSMVDACGRMFERWLKGVGLGTEDTQVKYLKSTWWVLIVPTSQLRWPSTGPFARIQWLCELRWWSIIDVCIILHGKLVGVLQICLDARDLLVGNLKPTAKVTSCSLSASVNFDIIHTQRLVLHLKVMTVLLFCSPLLKE